MPTREPWARVYREAPEVFEAFGRAEDPDGRVAQQLRARADLEGKRVLDLGCGAGRYCHEWAQAAAQTVGLEPSRPLLARALASPMPAFQGVQGRGEALPFQDQTFDRVLATWVLAYLPPKACDRVIQEALRVLRPGPGAGIWLLENHWTGEFQALRGREGLDFEPGVKRLIEDHGFQVVDLIQTELRFASEADAEAVLGTLCGPAVRNRLQQEPRARLGHHVVLLHHPAL